MDEEYYKQMIESDKLKDTKYWLKKDAETFKKGLVKILKVIGILLFISLFISLLINYTYDSFLLPQILIMTVYIFPIVLLGFVLIYSIVFKGHNIYSDDGLRGINGSRLPDSFKKEK